MTMHVNLSPEMESYIKGKVSTGFYGNATEVIRDAIRRMSLVRCGPRACRADRAPTLNWSA
jgi:putative addiction module CopG family antidote